MSTREAASPALAPPGMSNQASLLTNKHIWGGFVIAILAAFVFASLYLCFKRKFHANFRLRRKQKGLGNLEAEIYILRQFQLDILEKATNNFSQDCLVGSGAYGDVYKGTFAGEGTLAVKKLQANSYTSNEEFRNEVRLLAKVRHRNLVQLLGFCEETGPKGAKILVYEFVSNGSLLDYIMGRAGRSLTWSQRVNIAIGTAKGIAHLHEGIKPSIIHRDIKPSNILVGEGFEAKVSDFGLVKTGPIGDQSHVSSQVKGTPGYLDPAYCTSFHLTQFTDVYSFGVILLQLIAGRPAVDTRGNQPNNHIIEWARPSLDSGSVEEILDANLLSEQCNMEMMLKMGQLGLRCVTKVPKERPTMAQVLQELEGALFSAQNFIHKQPTSAPWRLLGRSSQSKGCSSDHAYEDHSWSISLNGIGLERFHLEMDIFSIESASLRCLETDNLSIEIDVNTRRGIAEETRMTIHKHASIPC